MAGFKTQSELIWGSAENGRFWEAALYCPRPSATTGIGPVGEVVTCRRYLRHGSRSASARNLGGIGSAASRANNVTARAVLLVLHHRIWQFPLWRNTNPLPSPPAMPVTHTARHRLLRGQPTPGKHRHHNRRGAKMCVSTVYVLPIAPHPSRYRRGAVRARSDHGAGRLRLVAVRPAHSYWAGAGWCLGPLPAVFLQMSRRPAYSKTSRQPARWRRRALPQTSPRPG